MSIPRCRRSFFLPTCLFWPSLLWQLSTSQVLAWESSCYVVLQVGHWGRVIHWVPQMPWVCQNIQLPSHLAVHPLNYINYVYSCNINVMCCRWWKVWLHSDARALRNL